MGEELIGRVIDSYRVLRPIGQGGMGEVYEVEHVTLHQRYALKLFAPSCGDSPEQRQRFIAEARIMARLNHPNLIKVSHLGEVDGRYYLIEELAARSLASLLTQEGTPDDEQHVWQIAKQIASAIRYAHDAGIVHRDLKPDNILFRADGTVVVSDFGIAKIMPESYWTQWTLAAQSQTLEHGANHRGLGTVNYAAPEQIAGAPVTPQFDIYAVGVILYELLTGTIFKHKRMRPSQLGHSGSWDLILDQCLARDPSERYQSADELCRALEKPPHEPIAKQKVSTFGLKVFLGIVLLVLLIWKYDALEARFRLARKSLIAGLLESANETSAPAAAAPSPEPSAQPQAQPSTPRWITDHEQVKQPLDLDPYYEPLRDQMAVNATVSQLHEENKLPQSKQYLLQRYEKSNAFTRKTMGTGSAMVQMMSSASEKANQHIQSYGRAPTGDKLQQAIESAFQEMIALLDVTDPEHIQRLREHLQARLIIESRKYPQP